MSVSFDTIEKTCLPRIEQALGEFFARLEKEYPFNVEMARYHFATGGKRLRALIPCWVYATLGQDPQRAIPLGVALELIHNATLVHDDLQDGDTLRRGQPTVWKKYNPAQAINGGDALFFLAFEALADLDVKPAVWRAIAGALSKGVLAVIEGQAQELLMKDETSPGWQRYLGVVTGKTAYLIATAVASALLALEEQEAVREWALAQAIASGVLFQIQDDLLDVYGDKQRERRASDIAEGKISALVALFNEIAPADERAFLASVLRAPREQVSADQIARVLQLFEKRGVLGMALDKLHALRAPSEAPSPSTLDADARARVSEMDFFFREMNAKFLQPIASLEGRNGSETKLS